MKLNNYIFIILIITGLFTIKLNAQDVPQETQSTTINQEEQSQPQSQPVSQSQTQPKVQTPSVPKLKPFPDTLNIPAQFDYAIDKSGNFQDYKVIKKTWMSQLKLNTLDSIQTLKTNLKSSENLIQEKNKTIESLRSELNTTQSELKEKNSFGFFGIMVSKTGYDTIMWSIIIGLLIALGFLFIAFRRAYVVTGQTRKDLNDVKDEFEDFRKKALKSKEEVVRQLYDELNKYKNKK